MKIITNMVFLLMVFAVFGCHERTDPRIHLGQGVKSDSLADNIVTRPVVDAFSALTGQGIEIDQAITRRNEAGFLELHVNGYNRSRKTRPFRYKVEWLDESGVVIETKTSVWLPTSAAAQSPFSIKAVAPRTEAVNFRMNTRKWE